MTRPGNIPTPKAGMELRVWRSRGGRLDRYSKEAVETTGKTTGGERLLLVACLTLNFLVAVVNTLNTKTHSSKEMAEFCFENADGKSICYCNTEDEKQTVTCFRMC